MKKTLLLSFIFFLVSGFVSLAQVQLLTLTQNHKTGIYRKDEKIRVMAYIPNHTNDSLKVIVRQNNDQVVLKKIFIPQTDSLLIYEGSSKKPSGIIVEARLKGEKQSIGMIIDPEKIKPGSKAPKDFKAYWKKEKQNIKALPMKVNFGKNECESYQYVCFDTEINCTGPKPAQIGRASCRERV
jgi:hypothetical protein